MLRNYDTQKDIPSPDFDKDGVVEEDGVTEEDGTAKEDNMSYEFDMDKNKKIAQAMTTLGNLQTDLVQLTYISVQ